ncbi:UxaA family hydrolase [Peptoniphilus sp. MSJ-1]|uniref:UxaA family hydrolase n=1 Tax=Peptoniphilus ovalis TaxID=2841503 RepID=A0ABS6FDH0_9FIRM|nr:UxaA family hydrolase [Peptoniphilus ovalis]MBU5668228.1 UxaA family hydrolase [Peptoniphilus ovalis]
MINALKISEKDNVVVVIENITKGEIINYRDLDGTEKKFEANDDTKIYHKIADRDIKKGENIIKYGEHIGVALEDIKKGDHVHTSNTEGRREDLKDKE